MAGLFLSGVLALIQNRTGLGLIYVLKDSLGYAALGSAPDIHAFAGYILLGALGLWGYFFFCTSKAEKVLVLIIVILSWIALLLSYSRATQLIALMALTLLILVGIFGKNNRQLRMRSLIALALLMGIGVTLIFSPQKDLLAFIPWRYFSIFKAISDND